MSKIHCYKDSLSSCLDVQYYLEYQLFQVVRRDIELTLIEVNITVLYQTRQ